MKSGKTPFKRQNKEGNRHHNDPRNFQNILICEKGCRWSSWIVSVISSMKGSKVFMLVGDAMVNVVLHDVPSFLRVLVWDGVSVVVVHFVDGTYKFYQLGVCLG
jgi:hypothetical protein